MNRIYRLIRNAAGREVPAPETSVGRGKGLGLPALAAALGLAAASTVHALPEGAQVSAGSGSVAQSGATMVVTQASARLALDWQRFDIAAGETVNFVQPGASAIALNRVLGSDGSRILGRLNANGQVFLLNPNGVLFGPGAQVDVGGLVASTLGLSNADFLAGRHRFGGSGGSVVNQGSLAGSYVALLGGRVSNEGVFSARLGTVALAAGNRVTLDFAGDRLLGVQVDEGALDALAQNRGLIRADGGTVLMTARGAESLLRSVVNNEGVIEARSIEQRDGVIRLLGDMEGGTVQVGGTLDASAAAGGGGFIDTSAAQVRVAPGAVVKAGHWLIDPTDVLIDVPAAGAIAGVLDGGGNVTVDTAGPGGDAGDITVEASIAKTAGGDATLHLKADNAIVVKAGVSIASTSGKLDVVLNADADGSGGGHIRMEHDTTISTHGGNLVMGGGNCSNSGCDRPATGDMGIDFGVGVGGADALKPDPITLRTEGGKVSIQGRGVASHGIAASNLDLDTGGGDLVLSGTSDANGWGVYFLVYRPNRIATGAGDLQLTGINLAGGIGKTGLFFENTELSTTTGTLHLTGIGSGDSGDGIVLRETSLQAGSGDILIEAEPAGSGTALRQSYGASTIAGSGRLTLRPYLAASDFHLGATELGLIQDGFSAITVGRADGTGTVTLDGWNVPGSADLAVRSGGAGSGGIALAGALTLGAGRNLTLDTTGTVTQAAPITTAGLLLQGSGGNHLLTQSGNRIGTLAGDTRSVQVTADGDIAVGAVSGVSGLRTGGDIVLAAGEDIRIDADISSNGRLTLEYGQQALAAGNAADYHVNARVNLLAGPNFRTRLGSDGMPVDYTVITSLGIAGDAGTASLQGMKNGLAGRYALGSDIDAGATATWNGGKGFTPVGDLPTPFSGRFEGLGHTVSGLAIERPDDTYVGLFGYLAPGASVRNLGLQDARIRGDWQVGALAGRNLGAIAHSWSSAGTVDGVDQVGGLVGWNDVGGTLLDSHVDGGTVAGGGQVGGLVGDNAGRVESSHAGAAVRGDYDVGGLAGRNSGTLAGSYATGSVEGNSNVGGLLGYDDGGTIDNSHYAIESVAINGISRVTRGGLYADQYDAWFAGGLTPLAVGAWFPDTDTDGAWLVGDLAGMKNLLAFADDPAHRFRLGADVDLAGAPGYNLPWLAASFDGAGHVLSGVAIDLPNTNVGLFASIAPGATVSNLGLADASVNGKWSVGALAGRNDGSVRNAWSTGGSVDGRYDVGGLVGWNTGDVQDSHAEGSVSGKGGSGGIGGLAGYNEGTIANAWAGGTVVAGDTAGGLVGWNAGDIQDSHASAAVSGSGGFGGFGGLVGYNEGSIVRAHASGAVDGDNSVGGLVGYNDGTIHQAWSDGAVSGSDWSVGGLAGENWGSITDAEGRGTVTGGDDVGGLVGWNGGSIADAGNIGTVSGGRAVGGLVGTNSGSIDRSWNTGTVSGSWDVGGLVGDNSGTGIARSWSTGTVSGDQFVGGLVGFNGSTISDSYVDAGAVHGNAFIGGLAGRSFGTLDNSHYNVDQVTLNDVNAVTPGGLYARQYADWQAGGRTPLAIGAYSDSLAPAGAGVYTIDSLQGMKDLLAFADDPAYTFRLGADLDLAGLPGYNVPELTADFDGAGHTLSHLAIDLPNEGIGLFGRIAAGTTVRNLGLHHAQVSGGLENVGSLAGYSDGDILDSHARDVAVSGGDFVGGLVGYAVGTVENAYATGTVSGSAYVGGLAGHSEDAIRNAWSSAAVRGDYAVGGLAGDSLGAIANSYASGTVSAGPDSGSVGGLVGYSDGTITDSYASGRVDAGAGSIGVGALVGDNGGTVSRSYWNADASPGLDGIGGGNTAGATGLSATDMQQAASFAGWSISGAGGSGAVWRIYEGHTDPLLRSFLTPLAISADDVTKTYDGTAYTGPLANVSYSDPAAALSPELINAGTPYGIGGGRNVGSYAPQLWSTQLGYDITLSGGQLTVDKASLTLGTADVVKTYDGTTGANGTPTVVAGTLFGGDTLAGGTFAFTDPNAGSGKRVTVAGIVVDDGNGGGNYDISYADNTTSTIERAALTITADSLEKVYGASLVFSGNEFSTAGLKNGETVGSVSLSSAGAGATASVAGGPYAISASGASGGSFSASNYDIAYVDGQLTVKPAPLTITADSLDKVYGDSLVFSGNEFIATGLKNGETVGSVSLSSAGAAATANVAGGPYAISASGASGGSFTAGNYDITYVDGALVVKPAALTITASDLDKVYGDSLVFSGNEFIATGLKNGETVGSVSLSSAGAAATANVAGDPYAISASGASGGSFSASNYDIAYVDGQLTVKPAALTITADSLEKVYGGNLSFAGNEFSASGLKNGESVGSVSLSSAGAAATANVAGGPYAISASGASGGTFDAGNYSITYEKGQLTVKPAPLTITADSLDKVYGDSLVFSGNEFIATGLKNGETVGSVSLSSAGAAATANVAGGPYDIVASSASGGSFDAGNYSITFEKGQLTVKPAPLTITADSLGKVYGDNLVFSGNEFRADGLKNGETVGSVSLSSAGAAATANVAGGPYAISVSGASGGSFTAGNYDIAYVDGALTITPAPLVITALDASKFYGDTLGFAGNEFSAAGLKNGETVGSVSLSSAGAAATASVGGGPYDIDASSVTGGTFDADNYTVTFAKGVLTVRPAPLTVTADSLDKVYGDSLVFSGNEFSATGLKNGETVGSVSLSSAGAAASANVAGGPYDIVASSASGGSFDAGNYSITFERGQLTVNPAPLTITADSLSKVYGDNLVFSGNEFSATGLKNGETVGSVSLSSAGAAETASVAGGPYDIVASSASGGTFDAGNYSITYEKGQLTVKPAPLTITADSLDKVYGDSLVFSGNEFSAAGLQNGETVGSVSLSSAGAATTANVAGGPYDIVASSASGGSFDAGNYSITFEKGQLTVKPAPLTITADSLGKVYGDSLVFSGNEFIATGLKNGETVGSVSLSSAGAAATANVAGGPYAISASGASGGSFAAGNYDIAYVDGALTVTPAPLVITALDASKFYGDTLGFAGNEFSAAGLKNGETVGSVSLSSLGAAATAGVADGPYAIAASGGTGGTFRAGNYDIAYANGTLTVKPAPLVISADSLHKVYGEANPALTATATGWRNGDSDALVSGLATTASAASGVGAYLIDASGAGAGPNYVITASRNGTLTITPAPLVIRADDKSRLQGLPNPALTATYHGFVAGDDPSALSGSLVLDTSAVPGSAPGSYAIRPSGQSAANYAIRYVDGRLVVRPALEPILSGAPAGGYRGALVGAHRLLEPERARHAKADYRLRVVGSGIRLPSGLPEDGQGQ